MSVPTVLEKIIARKVEEVAERSARVSLAELEGLARHAGTIGAHQDRKDHQPRHPHAQGGNVQQLHPQGCHRQQMIGS